MLFNRKKYLVTLPEIDCHNHLLPKVDDGFDSEAKSLSAISTMAEAGVRHIILTPHVNPEVYPTQNESTLKTAFDSFHKLIPNDWGVQTDLAAEYMIYDGFENRASDPSLLTFSDNSLLMDMSYYYESQNLKEVIFQLNLAGRKPILAHPERYVYYSKNLKIFNEIVDMGCRLQLNWMSLTGIYGADSMKILNYLLKNDMYSFICTDLHTTHQLQTILTTKLDKTTITQIEQLKEKMCSKSIRV